MEVHTFLLQMVLKGVKNGPWRFNHCNLNVMVLKEVKMVHGGLTTVI